MIMRMYPIGLYPRVLHAVAIAIPGWGIEFRYHMYYDVMHHRYRKCDDGPQNPNIGVLQGMKINILPVVQCPMPNACGSVAPF